MKSILLSLLENIGFKACPVSGVDRERTCFGLASAYMNSMSLTVAGEPAGLEEAESKPVILYAEIAAHFRLTEQDGPGAYLFVSRYLDQVKSHIAIHGGRDTNSAGNSVLAEFVDAETAMLCAIDIQQAARQWNASLDFGNKFVFRIGVSHGNLAPQQRGKFGRKAYAAARTGCFAQSCGICVTESVRRHLVSNACFRFISMGSRNPMSTHPPVEMFWVVFSTKTSPAFGYSNEQACAAIAS
ncbi:MAG: hypothetical protein GY875_08210 [Gammaproteobacteria bacterium]|nr:hypothetical protein [Gammaproteobacteria bacterium]